MIVNVCLAVLTITLILTTLFLLPSIKKYIEAKTNESVIIAASYIMPEEKKVEEYESINILEQIQDEPADFVVMNAIRDPGMAAQYAWIEDQE